MNPNETALAVLAGIGVASLIYAGTRMTGDNIVPETQHDEDMIGLNVKSNLSLNVGTPLDMSHEIHGWHPGYDPDPQAQPVTQSRHRYPSVPGGNLSTVMHKGWSTMNDSSPSGNDWRVDPPEAAVL